MTAMVMELISSIEIDIYLHIFNNYITYLHIQINSRLTSCTSRKFLSKNKNLKVNPSGNVPTTPKQTIKLIFKKLHIFIQSINSKVFVCECLLPRTYD